MFMVRYLCCVLCGHIVVEETTKQGTMISCLPGHVYEDGQGGCGAKFWIDED